MLRRRTKMIDDFTLISYILGFEVRIPKRPTEPVPQPCPPTRCEAYPAVDSISRWRCASGLRTLDSDKYCYLFFNWWISLSVAYHPLLNAPSFSSPENTGFVETNAHCNFTSPSFNTQLSPLDQAAVYNWSRRIPVFSLPPGSNNEEIVSILREGLQATVNQFPDLAGSCTQPPQPRNGEK